MKANLTPFISLTEPVGSSLGLDQNPHAWEITRCPLAFAPGYWIASYSGKAFGPLPIPGFTMSNREPGIFPGQPDLTGVRSGVVNGFRRCPRFFDLQKGLPDCTIFNERQHRQFERSEAP